MDPLTAAALAVKAIAEMVTAIVQGQPPEVKKQIWDWYVTDIDKLRKMLKLD